MAQTTWADVSPVAKRITVYFENADSDAIVEGMPLCYNHDTTTNWSNIDKSAAEGLATFDTSTPEGSQNEGKWIRVEVPSATNQRFFAGVVAKGSDGIGTSVASLVDIYVDNCALVPVYTDSNVTIGDPAYVEFSETTVVNTPVGGGVQIGWFDETIDRSTAGLALVKLNGPDEAAGAIIVSARSRAVTAMPTEAIWRNFDLASLASNPGASFLDIDFTKGEIADDIDQADATAAVFNLPGTAGIGEVVLFQSVDNEEAAVQWNCPITVSGGNPWAFEIRLKVENITDARATCYAGLFVRAAELSGDVVADNGAALTLANTLGFVRLQGDGNAIDFIYADSGATVDHDAGYVVPVADTYLTLGMHYNGTTIQGYLNGVATGTAISTTDIADGDFPAAAVIVPTLANKGDNAADFDYSIDWIRVAQHAL